MTQPDIYTAEARRRFASCGIEAPSREAVDLFAATLRELNWQPPVDLDLVEARKIASNDFRRDDCFAIADMVERGGNDDCSAVRMTLAAIKRGRELERGA